MTPQVSGWGVSDDVSLFLIRVDLVSNRDGVAPESVSVPVSYTRPLSSPVLWFSPVLVGVRPYLFPYRPLPSRVRRDLVVPGRRW